MKDGGETMSLTDEIYLELCDGLEKGLDWPKFLAKYKNSKGPLYNAIGRFFNEVALKIQALNEEKSRVQGELNRAELELDSLDQRKEEAESNIVSLENRGNTLTEQVETLEDELAEKGELAKRLAELERLSFDTERLIQLQETLREIGMKHSLKGKEAVGKFFDALKDYGTVLDAELQLKGLETQIETKKLEAENWQAKEEALKRKHNDLKEAIEAVHVLRAKGIKPSQIITWHRILSRFQTVEEFDQSLAQFGDIIRLLNAKKEETENWELRLANAQGQVETLEKERAKIEGEIDALKKAGMKELKAMTEAGTKQLKMLAENVKTEIREVGQEVRKEFNDFVIRLDALVEKVFEIGQKFEGIRRELQKYEGVKDVIESHVAASEADNEVPEQS
jgi:chromosome segregation ATPase